MQSAQVNLSRNKIFYLLYYYTITLELLLILNKQFKRQKFPGKMEGLFFCYYLIYVLSGVHSLRNQGKMIT